MPEETEFASSFAPFYRIYGNRYPVVISETSSPFHYEIPSNYPRNGPDSEIKGEPDLSLLTPIPAVGSANELNVKSNWFEQMTGPDAARRFPNLTSVSVFNYLKEGNLSQWNDFRYVGGKPEIESWMRDYVGNVTAYQGGFSGKGESIGPGRTLLVSFAVVSCIYCMLC